MPQNILVAVAWPYANGSLHLGQIAGCYLPADIFARYHRLTGNKVLMVSGSDQHGTPITLRAEKEGLSPKQVVNKYHNEFLNCWKQLGISFDLFTTTGTANHQEVVHDIFLTLLDKGYIYKNTTHQAYCSTDRRFLPDRYVEGSCPHCEYVSARGDQCDQCGKPLNADDLIDIRCLLCGEKPEFRESEHFFFKLSAFQDLLLEWVRKQEHWRPNVLNFTLRYLEDGLKDRAMSRDIEWGVPIPVTGYNQKRIYVWFEAVVGYLSASKEWAQHQGDPEMWREFWQNPLSRAYYFMAKDNVPFHTIIWPAMLLGYTDHNLPYDIPSNEYLTLERRKFSTSQNWALWLTDYLSRYEPDPLRYFLSANMPETGDSDFSWSEFVRRNNDELVATYGNLVHRVLTITHRQFDAKVPHSGELDDADRSMLQKSMSALEEIGNSLSNCHFKEAVRSFLLLAQETNRYLDAKAPWKTVKTDKVAAATTLWVCLNVISCLKTITYPFMPFSAHKLHSLLGFQGSPEEVGWNIQEVMSGQAIPQPQALFNKLENDVAQEEAHRLISKSK